MMMQPSTAYGIPRNETKRNETKRNEMKRNETKRNEMKSKKILHKQKGTMALTIIPGLSSKTVLARSLVSQNTNGGRLVIDETRLANYFYKRSAFENYLVR